MRNNKDKLKHLIEKHKIKYVYIDSGDINILSWFRDNYFQDAGSEHIRYIKTQTYEAGGIRWGVAQYLHSRDGEYFHGLLGRENRHHNSIELKDFIKLLKSSSTLGLRKRLCKT